MAGGRIFINYRRDDSRADSGRLYDRLVARFPDKVFRDVASLEPGVEWQDAIARVLGQTDACIVVIGKDWLNITGPTGRRRLDDPHDNVRQEIEIALQRQMRVFPVLVGGAKMPAEEDVPAELRALCRRNAVEITEQDWDEGFRKLVTALETALGLSSRQSASVRTSPGFKWPLAVLGSVLAVVAVAALALWAWSVKQTQRAGEGPPIPSEPAAGRPKPGSSTPIDERRPPRDNPPLGAPVTPPESPSRRALTDSQLTGTWAAVVTGGDQRLNEEVEMYHDQSFRVTFRSEIAAVGRWRYNSGTEALEISGANFLAGGSQFACTWKRDSEGGESFSGGCVDRMRNSWIVSLTRSGRNLPEVAKSVSRVDLSGLTIAEQAAFIAFLAEERCTCPTCGMTLLMCLEKDLACPYSPERARTELADFLQIARM